MTKTFYVDDLCGMLENEQRDVLNAIHDYDTEEENALKIGDQGTATHCRLHIKRLERRYAEIGRMLNEINRLSCAWRIQNRGL